VLSAAIDVLVGRVLGELVEDLVEQVGPVEDRHEQ
jgi:hypothetical protein